MKRGMWIVTFLLVIGATAIWVLRGQIRAMLFQPTAADLAYGAASPAQTLDLYAPKTGEGPFPVVVYIHGGAFQFGDKRELSGGFVDGIQALNAQGIAVASINYRMAAEARFPAAVTDARSAVRWLRANAAAHRLNPDGIGVWGKSAGGYLAMMVGVTDAETAFDDAAIAPGVSSRVAAVVAMYGPTDFLQMDAQLRASPCGGAAATHDAADSPESKFLGAPVQSNPALAQRANPAAYVRADAPPMVLQAGDADCTVPHEQTLLMAAALKAKGAPVEVQIFPGAGHVDAAFGTPSNLRLVADHFARHLAKP